MKIGVLQSDGAGLSKRERLDLLVEALAGPPLDLLVTPELFLSGYNVGDALHALAEPADGPSLAGATAIAARAGTALVLGFAERSAGGLYNAAAVIGPDGRLHALHRKRRNSPNSFEERVFATGNRSTLFDLGDVRCAVLICFESELPEYAREAALGGAELLCVLIALSDDWPDVADRLIPTRAFENGVWMAYANHAGQENGLRYLGGSRIVGPDWAQDAVAGHEAGLIAATFDRARITRARARLPYLRIAQAIVSD